MGKPKAKITKTIKAPIWKIVKGNSTAGHRTMENITCSIWFANCQKKKKKSYLIKFLRIQLRIQKLSVSPWILVMLAGNVTCSPRDSQESSLASSQGKEWLSSDMTQLSGSVVMRGAGRPRRRELSWLTEDTIPQGKEQGQRRRSGCSS